MRSNIMRFIAIFGILAILIAACSSYPENGNANIAENTNNLQNGEENTVNDSNEAIENSEDVNVGDTSAGPAIDPDYIPPIMDDATDLYSNINVVDSYQTNHSLDEISAFYNAELLNLGYTKGYEILVADKLIMRFEKGNFNIVVSTASNGSDGFFVSVGPQDE